MSRLVLKGKEEGSELVVGLDPPLQSWFWQWYPRGENSEDEGPDVWKDSRSNYDLLGAIDQYADKEHAFTKVVRNFVGGDWDPGEKQKQTHWRQG